MMNNEIKGRLSKRGMELSVENHDRDNENLRIHIILRNMAAFLHLLLRAMRIWILIAERNFGLLDGGNCGEFR